MKSKQTTNIYQSRKGINLTDGYFLARNPVTKQVAIISIVDNIASMHYVKHQISLQQLVNMDSLGHIDVYGVLKMIEPYSEKEKHKKQ